LSIKEQVQLFRGGGHASINIDATNNTCCLFLPNSCCSPNERYLL